MPKFELKAVALALIVAQCAFVPAQMPPRGGAGAPPQQRQQVVIPDITATVQLLSRTDVQNDLQIDALQYKALSEIVQNLANQEATEDAVRARVATVLSQAQMTRLTELTIQYIGYGALALSDVRTKLKLTTDQTTRITDILSQFTLAKRAIRTNAANAVAAKASIAELQTQTNAQLAKVLTSDQDTLLHSFAGKALGS